MTKSKATRQRVQDCLDYDPNTGRLTWKITTSSRAARGSAAGSVFDGYLRVGLNGKLYQATHLIWMLVYGVWPPHMVDHKDRNTLNNQLNNLRLATNTQNQWNKVPKCNTFSGLKGVTVMRRRGRITFRAVISEQGRQTVLGEFNTPEKAHAAYVRAARERHGEFARAR